MRLDIKVLPPDFPEFGLSAVTHPSRQRRVHTRNGWGLRRLGPPSIFSTPPPVISRQAMGT